MSDFIDERGPGYRDDDRNVGYCPTCGQACVDMMVNGAGWCPDHGKVFANWEPPDDVPVEEDE